MFHQSDSSDRNVILIRGGGDLASGVALRLHRVGLKIIIIELPQPLAIRRTVAFANAVYTGEWIVEGVVAKLTDNLDDAFLFLQKGNIPVMVDPEANLIEKIQPLVIIDGRMTKQAQDLAINSAGLVIGLGPAFIAGVNCHAAIETRRGPRLGRVVWSGSTEDDTGVPESVGAYGEERVLRAPAAGVLKTFVDIGALVKPGQVIAEVSGLPVRVPFRGVLRGLLHPGLQVFAKMKIGDVDPRANPELCHFVSDKALSVGGGALEAILTKATYRQILWQ